MSTRYKTPFEFDHGAPYFSIENTRFRSFLRGSVDPSFLAEWPNGVDSNTGEKSTSYVSVPKMTSVCKSLADSIDVSLQTEIGRIERCGDVWDVIDVSGLSLGRFDWVVSSAPAPQAAQWMPSEFAGYDVLAGVKMLGVFSLMLGFNEDLSFSVPFRQFQNSPVGKVMLNSSKPGRSDASSIVVQSSTEWAERHMESDRDWVTAQLIEEASRLTAMDMSSADHCSLHRWRYAIPSASANVDYLFDKTEKLAACGDWCLGGGVEAAFLSADRLFDAFSENLNFSAS